jgi:hypothetical protein
MSRPFDKSEIDALYTLLEWVHPSIEHPEFVRTAEYFMDRCEGIVGMLRRDGEKINTNRFSTVKTPAYKG